MEVLINGVIGDGRRDEIESLVLGLDEVEGLGVLSGLLETRTENPIARKASLEFFWARK